MNRKKGGLFLVGMGLLIILMCSVVADININTNKYQNLYAKGDDDYGNNNDHHDITFQNYLGSYYGIGCEDGQGWPSVLNSKSENGEDGCYFFAVEEDSCPEDDDSYGYSFNSKETIVDNTQKQYCERRTKMLNDDDSDWENIACSDKNSVVGGIGLCADDFYWHVCTDNPNDFGTVTWANNNLYKCTFNQQNTLYWIKVGSDKDQDGYVNDCADDPNQPDLTAPSNCPPPGHPEECQYPRDSHCSICINPGAPEICGDEVDNNCNGNEDENCDNFKEGCQQEAITDPVTNAIGAINNNVYNQKFSWQEFGTINTPEQTKGYCCGSHGMADLGLTLTNKDGQGFICLNKDQKLVGAEKELTALGWNDENCGTDWCWLPSSGDLGFNILTIKKPGEKPFDVVSNQDQFYTCKDESSAKTLPQLPAGLGDIGAWTKSNRFYCYNESNHWSWAECAPDLTLRANKGIKGRYEGESLFTLPLKKGEEDPAEVFLEGNALPILAKFYGSIYDQKYLLDFSNYDYLNFFVQFTDGVGNVVKPGDPNLKLPADISLEIGGETPYFRENVLGYVISQPFFADNWMQVQVRLPANLRGVSYVLINAVPSTNKIKVRNIYLSKEGKNPLCSGIDASGRPDVPENAWLSNADQSDVNKEIKGEKLCQTLYGENAWLGNNEEVDNPEHSCCGNTPREYYAGKSVNGYGCWNSQPIADKQTTMDVQFEVKYKENEYSFPVNEPQTVNYKIDVENKPDCQLVNSENIMSTNRGSNIIQCTGDKITPPTGDLQCDFTINKYSTDITCLNKITIASKITGFDVSFINTLTGEETSEIPVPQLPPISQFQIVAKINSEYQIESTPPTLTEKIKLFTFSCPSAECLYPLPGRPEQGYTIINKHPELYELFFLGTDVNGRAKPERLITNSRAPYASQTAANLKVKKVAQQVLYVNNPEKNEFGFFGCQATNDLVGTGNPIQEINNLGYCQVKGEKFCAPSTIKGEGKEKYTTINSWSDTGIEKIGYDTLTPGPSPAETELLKRLKTAEPKIPANARTQLAEVTPGKNFLSNAEFLTEIPQIPHWELYSGSKLAENPASQVQNKKLTLNGETLRSERIALQPGTYSFSANGSCPLPQINIYKKEATEPELIQFNSENTFNTFTVGEDASYLILEFSGYCELWAPMLQKIDENYAPTNYSYVSQHQELQDYDARAELSCCPAEFCWNGYACVTPMTNYTSLVEHINAGQDYRCINGKWITLPLKLNWNFDPAKWGFCNKKEQCFVLSDNEGAKAEFTAQTFYEQKYPLCIDSGQYILDHYCDQGNWSSRTKFLANKLLDVGEGAEEEYVLYCTNYKDALLSLDEKENYLGGGSAVETTTTPTNPLEATQTETIPACFNAIKSLSTTLVPERENTCVNNFCILKQKGQVVFGTTLNKELNDPNSFLYALNIPQEKIAEICPVERAGQEEANQKREDFVECDLSGLEIPGSLWYSPKLKAIVYSKQNIGLTPSIGQKIVDYIKSLFGMESPLSQEKKFIQEAKNFRELYLLKTSDGKSITAAKEILPHVGQTLVAEYAGFTTPVCSYVDVKKMNIPQFKTELLPEEQGRTRLLCQGNITEQKVEAVAHLEALNTLWPQLTSKLRVNQK